MYIVSKDRTSIVNAAQITSLYIGADNCTVKADFKNGKGCQLGRYGSEKECQAAIDIIVGNLGKTDICFMPNDSAINTKSNPGNQKPHNINGKKTKGHGGS